MKTKRVIESELEGLLEYDFLFVRPADDKEDGYFVGQNSSDDELKRASKDLKISVDAVKAITESFHYFAETLVEKIKEDLEDIWDKVSNE